MQTPQEAPDDAGPSPREKEIKNELDNFAGRAIDLCKVSAVARIWRIIRDYFVLVVIAALVVLFIAYLGPNYRYQDDLLKAFAAIVAGIGLSLTYLQWQLARREITYDKYYDRLKESNQYKDRYWCARTRNEATFKGMKEFLLDAWVFAEIDNLEYVLGKSRLGYAEYEIVRRSVAHFVGMCLDPDFLCRVMHWIGRYGEEQPRAIGYRDETRGVIRMLERDCLLLRNRNRK